MQKFWKRANRFYSLFDMMGMFDQEDGGEDNSVEIDYGPGATFNGPPPGAPGSGSYVGDYSAPTSPYQPLESQLGGMPAMDGFFPAEGAAAAPAAPPAAGANPMYGPGGQMDYRQPGYQAAPTAAQGKLGIPQAYQTFRQAGFDDADARLMTAIAMGESGLDPQAHNPNAATGDNSYGLTQINMLGNLQGPRLKEFGIQSNEQLFDPLTNAKAAYAVSGGGQNFSPWSVYKKGAHQQYIDDVEAALLAQMEQQPPEEETP